MKVILVDRRRLVAVAGLGVGRRSRTGDAVQGAAGASAIYLERLLRRRASRRRLRANRSDRTPRPSLRCAGFTSATIDISGYMLGGQIGCDYQFAPNWVVGIEGAAAGGNIGGSTAIRAASVIPGDTATFKETTDFLTSVTGRVGYAWDRWLLYGKGGAAWAGDRYSAFDATRDLRFRRTGNSARLDRRRRHRMGALERLVAQARIRLLRLRHAQRDVHRRDQRKHRTREHQPEHSGHQARSEFSRLPPVQLPSSR